MKNKLFALWAFLLVAACLSQHSNAFAEGTAFTYQGELDHDGGPASGTYNLTFSLFNTNTEGEAIAGPITNKAVNVTNGLFTVLIDFGSLVSSSGTNWLQIGVESNEGTAFVTLTPRQPLTPAPSAITAENLAGVLENNTIAAGESATVSGGTGNTSSGPYDTVGGGVNNTAFGYAATVSGGEENAANNSDATVGGGESNTASGENATVAGGYGNTASGDNSFAAGYYAQAVHEGSFVWSDDDYGLGGTFSSTAVDQFSVHASGGVVLAADVQIGTDTSDYHNLALGGGNSEGYLYGSYAALGDGIHLGYNFYYDAFGDGVVINSDGQTSRLSVGYGSIVLSTGGVATAPTAQQLVVDANGVTVNGSFNNNSDRNAKQDFASVSPSQMLSKVAQLPVSEWSYKEEPKTRHVGPMAQDFRSAFNLGSDDKHIAPMDEGGVALAAIQGLNQKLNEKDQEIQKLKDKAARVDSLEKRLTELEQVVQSLTEKD
jgi:trimeric autotransporter adhesin